ncbi:hypothetical protein FRC09_016724 [Ceratobasidium sp. 395]|nr:hypothetical protein FRC09_016724 [Ceratobasidium sp. 395]
MLDTSSSRVFHTPELLVVAPRIWNNLRRVQPLLSLLGPTVALKEDPYEYLDVALPAYSPEAFARFDLYAPLVQDLHISSLWKTYESGALKFSVSSWGCLTDRGSLLPNLHRLALSKNYRSDEEILLWLSSFVPLGLQDSQTTQIVSSPVVLRYLRGLQSLTRLRVHGCFVDFESFVIVSCLPKLESFYIINQLPYYDNVLEVLKFTPLRDDSFPALTTFHVISDWLDAIITSFQGASQTEQSMIVSVRYLPDRDDASSAPREPLLDHLTFVTTGSKPQSWPMYLGQMPLDWEQPPRTISEDPNWEYLRCFQLVKLGIRNSSPDPLFMQGSLPTLDSLLYLDMDDQFLTLSQLAYVGQQMPRLRMLRSNLVDALDKVPQTQHPSTAQLNKFRLVQPLKNRLKIRSPDHVAR